MNQHIFKIDKCFGYNSLGNVNKCSTYRWMKVKMKMTYCFDDDAGFGVVAVAGSCCTHSWDDAMNSDCEDGPVGVAVNVVARW